MRVQQLYTDCLAEAAYFIESNGEIAVIDPLRETQPYVDLAKAWGGKIKYIFETHFHADFVSGHLDLAKATGARIVYGPTAKPGFECEIAADNQVFQLGNVTITVLHTPGHTMESSTFLLKDENGKDYGIFTGDTLFLGDVGRPDLAVRADLSEEDLAGHLFDSLRNKIMPLPDDVIVYPGHGAGSSCGKNLSEEKTGRLGEQKATNYALRADMTKEEFVKEVTHGILPPPQYFPKNAAMNKTGYKPFEEVLRTGTTPLTAAALKKAVSDGAILLDVRTEQAFVTEYIPGSLFIGLNGNFAMWVGALIEDLKQPIVLIVPEGQESEAVTRLSRVGYDNCVGYLKGGIASWKASGEKTDSIASITADQLVPILQTAHLIDVRKPGEWDAGHVQTAAHYPLDYILGHENDLDKSKTYHIYCAGGYRSVIAISILKQHGYTHLVNILGGYAAIRKTPIPLSESLCSTRT